MIYKSRLFRQLVLFIGLIVVLAVGIPGVFMLSYLTPHFVEERYYKVMLNDVEFLAARLDWHLAKSLKDVDYLAKRVEVSSPAKLSEAGEVMDIFVRSSSIFTGAFLTDAQGIVQLFYSSPQGFLELKQKHELSDRDYIQRPLKKKQLFLSDVILTKDSNVPPVIYISSPVSENGRITGVLALSINLWNSNNIFHSLFQGFQSKKQGTIYVVDGQGTIIYHEDKEMVGKTIDPALLSYIAANQEGIAESISTNHGEVAAAFGKVTENNWVVVYEMSHEQIYALSKVSGDISAGTLLVVLVLGIGVSVVFAGIIIRPLEEITLATEQVAAGDLSRRIEQRGHPDFQRVIQNFNIMTTNLQVQYEELEKLSLQDYLTGLANRRYFEQQFRLELDRALRLGHPMTLLLLDVDDFKIINDKFGHLEGDKALKALAAVLKETVQEVDLPVRYGGEEFLALLPETSLEQGRLAAEKIREKISLLQIFSRKEIIAFTVSIGLSSTEQLEEIHSATGSCLTLIQLADEALYQAKVKGKNRVEVYQPLKP